MVDWAGGKLFGPVSLEVEELGGGRGGHCALVGLNWSLRMSGNFLALDNRVKLPRKIGVIATNESFGVIGIGIRIHCFACPSHI